MSPQQYAGDGSVYPAATEPPVRDLGVVHTLRFSTPDPLDHCARALDVMRRMGFDFLSMWARPSPSAGFLVHMNFVPLGALPPRILADRVSAFIGISEVELELE